MPFACIYVPDFPVAAMVRAEPDLRSQAVAVLAGKPPLEKVFVVNGKAERMGIEPGMSKAQVEICEELVLRPRSAVQESAAHAALVNCAQAFSPCVEDTAADTVLLDLAGLESLFGPLPQIARDLGRRAAELGLEANVGVAANPDTARLAARGFSGVTVIPAGKEAELLGRLPLEVLFGGSSETEWTPEAEQLLETFCRWGMRNLRALAALPEVALSERLGQEGIRLQKLARGATSRALVPVEPPLIFEETIELECPLVLLEPLAFALNHILEQICARLAAHALATQELRLEMELENAIDELHIPAQNSRNKFERILRLPVPLLDAKVFLKLLQLDLKAHPPGAPIVKIHLAAEPARPRAAQSGLFLPPAPEPEKLELTLARIAGIVGEEKVGSLELLDTHRPEGFRMRRFAPAAAKAGLHKELLPARLKPYPDTNQESAELGAGSVQSQAKNSDAVVTVLRIFRPALRASVTLRDDRPARIACDRQKEVHGEVIWAAGPWRSSGDWWEQEGWRRDEWDIAVQNETGIALYRLVRDLLRGCWLVEGTYD
jgi:protein ImuB